MTTLTELIALPRSDGCGRGDLAVTPAGHKTRRGPVVIHPRSGNPVPGPLSRARSAGRPEGAVLLGVHLARLWAAPPAVAGRLEAHSGPADPPDAPRGRPGDQGEVWHVTGHHGTGRDQGPAADRTAGH